MLRPSTQIVNVAERTVHKACRLCSTMGPNLDAFGPSTVDGPYLYHDLYTTEGPLVGRSGEFTVKTMVMSYAHYCLTTFGTEFHPGFLASDVSHGCIRVSDRSTTRRRIEPVITWDRYRCAEVPSLACSISECQERHEIDIQAEA